MDSVKISTWNFDILILLREKTHHCDGVTLPDGEIMGKVENDDQLVNSIFLLLSWIGQEMRK